MCDVGAAAIVTKIYIREWSLFMGGEGGFVNGGGGGKRSFTLINRGGGPKSFNLEKGGQKSF